MNLKMPELISLAVYDGIPPKEEGQDPTIFWYWPQSVDKNLQLNEIGLYMTFTGFCRDFRSSQDCEFFQTDKSLTVFVNLGAEVYIGAKFNTNDASYHRQCLQSIRTFASIYHMFFPKPYRISPDDLLDQTTMANFEKYLEEMLGIFKCSPILQRIPPSLDLWTNCEEAISNVKSCICTLRTAAFIYKGRLIHSTMCTDDLIQIYLSCRANMPNLFPCAKTQPNQSSFKWIMKNFNRELKFKSTTGYPAIFVFKQLIGILVFSKFSDYSAAQNVLEPLFESLIVKCDSTIESEINASPSAYRDNGQTTMLRPIKEGSPFSNPNKNELLVDFLSSNHNQFVRLCGKTDASPDSWIFLEKDHNMATFLDGQGRTLDAAMTNYSEFVKAANFG
ncbi:hypothetical protein TRFO_18389 [Tritrichomonas foetus]|uniref:CCZ1/INTU/HSP4 first Longin domain-containing protein n=1 Tax=Tritrichomonas foetus TaxID=1144522 RepID=A0A1J4KR27_9EUKA|nr:hypothetical protein TRFO_18389 [Tritrichomonas foetus]|eukprot:OHT11925.1 hypothetical protein TRFO_18389 [Tritrichomonas foetus]